jgi:hypothetical protein
VAKPQVVTKPSIVPASPLKLIGIRRVTAAEKHQLESDHAEIRGVKATSPATTLWAPRNLLQGDYCSTPRRHTGLSKQPWNIDTGGRMASHLQEIFLRRQCPNATYFSTPQKCNTQSKTVPCRYAKRESFQPPNTHWYQITHKNGIPWSPSSPTYHSNCRPPHPQPFTPPLKQHIPQHPGVL